MLGKWAKFGFAANLIEVDKGGDLRVELVERIILEKFALNWFLNFLKIRKYSDELVIT